VAVLFVALLSAAALPPCASAIEAVPEYFPLRPFNVDVSFNQRTFGPQARVIAVQTGFTALRYGLLEVRTVYQYYSHHTQTFTTDQHSLYVNPRWNNFIDLLDFPRNKPINRMIRHLLFGPLEDQAVPYVGALIGGTLPGRDANSPGYLYGGQLGVRFPVARGVSVDMGFQYSRFEIDFKSKSDLSEQWLFTIGLRL
jgi:opacity protein-like surface antigen